MKAFKRVVPILVWLVVSMPGAALAAFSTADLSGTWHLYVFFDHPTTDDPGWRRGTVTFNSSGVVTAGSLTDNENTTVSITSGSLSVNNLGFLSGSVLSSNAVTSTFTGGKMDKGKNFVSFVGTDNQDYRFKGSAIKAGGAFATADLAGTWHFYSFLGDPGADTASWSRGTIITNSSGTITGGSFRNDLNTTVNVSGGSISINSSGVFTGTINFSSGLVVTLSQGKLDAGKTTAAFVGTDNAGFVFAGQGIKSGGTFSTADLAGRWQFNTFWDDPLANDAGMEHGTVIVDSSGAITGGDFFDDEGFPMAVSGGMLTIDSAGIFSGTIEFFGGALIETISQGKLSGSKTVASYVGFDDAGFVFQGAALKIGDGINDFDDDGISEIVLFRGGAWLFHDFTTGTQNSGVWTGSGAGCLPVAMDYDGDGKTDFTQFCNGAWHFYNANGSYNKGIWTGGIAGDRPVPADYDGDGKDDVVVYRGGAWLFYNFTTGAFDAAKSRWTGGGGSCIPAPMDYDGDGTADFTQLCNGAWHFYNDNGSYNKGIWTGGVAGDLPAPADYDGDGKDDVVVFRAGAWLFYNFTTGAFDAAKSTWTGAPPHFTGGTSLPAPLDYDGDGKADFTVYSGGPWYFFNGNGTFNKGIWTGGIAGDRPISKRLLP